MRGLYRLCVLYQQESKPLFLCYVESCSKCQIPHVRRILQYHAGVYHCDDGTTRGQTGLVAFQSRLPYRSRYDSYELSLIRW
jgi:hypothetical protein